MRRFSEVIVVGAGIAGVMTALSLQRKGCRVVLIDRWEPGHSRASSTDYTRVTRSIHGKDEMYTQWARESRLRWMELQEEVGTPLYVECGALVMAAEGNSAWEDSTLGTFQKLGVPYFIFQPDELRIRFPQFQFTKVAYGIYEPEAGMLLSHRIIVEMVKLFERGGGQVVRGRVTTDEAERPCLNEQPMEADLIVMAAGPWLGDLFPHTIGPMCQVVRQDVIYTSTPDSDSSFDKENMPCWIDHGYGAYGTPSIFGYGVKAAIAWQEIAIDLDNDDRIVDESAIARSRQYLHYRIPKLVGQQLMHQKACQITMTPDTHFIIDFHPQHENVLIVGGCAGHLFKHGPVLGDYVAGVGRRDWGTAPRFKIGPRSTLSTSDSPSGR